jgi:hypothetical protein
MKFVTDVKFDEKRGKLRVAYHDIATGKATTSDDDEPISDNDTQQDVPNIVTSTAKPFGTAHWLGVYNGHPAVGLSHNGGATLWFYDHDISAWRVRGFSSYNALCEKLGIS